MFVRVGGVRLVGVLDKGCWPQRGSDLRCKDGPNEKPRSGTLPDVGKLRVVVAYPAQPDDGSGSIVVKDSKGEQVIDEKWNEEIDYELDPGTYTLTADARYPTDAYVRYVFRFRIR